MNRDHSHDSLLSSLPSSASIYGLNREYTESIIASRSTKTVNSGLTKAESVLRESNREQTGSICSNESKRERSAASIKAAPASSTRTIRNSVQSDFIPSNLMGVSMARIPRSESSAHLDALEDKISTTERDLETYRRKIDVLERLLPPFPCTHDERALDKIRTELNKCKDKVAELERSKYENGILLRRAWRKKQDAKGRGTMFFSARHSDEM
ncbi:hypothetical protein CANCADRAFT_72582 [Tortispora caseinolytica NRRL Y-17796]|uniref:Uncharacterized protein n=1 Tax=Tortispora caseinolytica NRRL Y-17796 TaxID=767744 RepID=A0A1E4TIF1_9ASCO|nr:hypothetical protein CANCADRAFT_72582 [Tortispora caseinolytica NRRL Y-17796]